MTEPRRDLPLDPVVVNDYDTAPGPDDGVGDVPSARLLRLAELTAAEVGTAVSIGGSPVLSVQAIADVLAAVDASTASNTKAAYRSDWARFTSWAGERGFCFLPADPLVVAHYVTEAAAEMTGVGRWRYAPATLTRWVSSINQFHTAADLQAPGRSEVLRRALSGIRRIRASPPVRRAPLLLEDIRTLMTCIEESTGQWPGGVAARRDMAVLLMGFAGASRRSELVALTVADVTLHRTDGLHVRLRTSKTDQEGQGAVKALPFGRDPATCPPCGFVRWRQILQAWDTANPGDRRRAVMGVLRRQAAATGRGGALHRVRRRAVGVATDRHRPGLPQLRPHKVPHLLPMRPVRAGLRQHPERAHLQGVLPAASPALRSVRASPTHRPDRDREHPGHLWPMHNPPTALLHGLW